MLTTSSIKDPGGIGCGGGGGGGAGVVDKCTKTPSLGGICWWPCLNLGEVFEPATVDIRVSMSGGIGVTATEVDMRADTGASKILGSMSTPGKDTDCGADEELHATPPVA